MFITYVIQNPQGKKYTGSTANIKERLEMHNNTEKEKARFHRTTYKKGPWSIIFQKIFKTRNEAEYFEKFLKTGKGRDWLLVCR